MCKVEQLIKINCLLLCAQCWSSFPILCYVREIKNKKMIRQTGNRSISHLVMMKYHYLVLDYGVLFTVGFTADMQLNRSRCADVVRL